MSNGWDQAMGIADRQADSGSGMFVRLANDGDKIVGAFLGDPYARETHWTGERYQVCTGEGCSSCLSGKRPNMRVSMNFYVPATKELKIIEGGFTWFKSLIKARDKYGLDKWLFEVERHGTAGDMKTSYTILPEEKLTSEHTKEIDALRLHDLPQAVSSNSDDSDSNDKNIKGSGGEPIDSGLAGQLAERLKALPRDAVDTFLAKFDIQRVRDLKVSQEKAATAFVATLADKHAPPGGKGGEVDPFA